MDIFAETKQNKRERNNNNTNNKIIIVIHTIQEAQLKCFKFTVTLIYHDCEVVYLS